MRFVLALISLSVLLIACDQKKYKVTTADSLLYCKTVKKLNDIVLENNFPPMIASRNYVYANIAAYECIVAGDSSYRSLAGQIKHMPAMPKPVAGKPVDFSLSRLAGIYKSRQCCYISGRKHDGLLR